MTAIASKAAWKNESVCRNFNAGVTVSGLMSSPVNSKLGRGLVFSVGRKEGGEGRERHDVLV